MISARTDHVPDMVQADVVVIGGGMAGLTLATALSGSSRHVTVLESGGETFEGATQELYGGRQTGLPYYDLMTCRLRYLGGTSNHWSGYCRPNDLVDYQARPDVGLPGWPITALDLEPYIVRAATMLGLDPTGFDPKSALRQAGIDERALVENSAPEVVTKVAQIATRIRISELFNPQIQSQKNLQIITHANVTNIGLSHDARRVERLTVKVLGGRQFEVRPRVCVLATHGIENARLLLASNDIQKSGIGNSHDQVGRYFMEHPYVVSGIFAPNPDRFSTLYNHGFQRRRNLNFNISLPDSVMKREGILQYYMRFWPKSESDDEIEALARLRDGFFRPFRPRMLRDGAKVARSPIETLVGLGERAGYFKPKLYELDHRIEQAPNPASRVILSSERDALGNQRADLNWDLNEVDFRTFEKGQRAVARAISSAGLGRFKLNSLTPDYVRSKVQGHYHHIGTTRMSESATDGVVNRDCRVHGVDNLYVAGSSVFPSSGYSGPTMMLMSTTLRLADLVKQI